MKTVEGTPLWDITAPRGPACGALGENISVAVAVVGGGFTGLSAALHSAALGKETVLLEAGVIGSGASGRTNGQVIPTLKKESPESLLRRYGSVHGKRVIRVVGKSADKLFSLVRDYGIDCEANQRGWIQPAVSQKQLERVRRCAESWSTQGANVEILGAKATAAALGSDFYRGGWRAVDGGSVQPLALARGLAMAAISEGARVCERSPVSAIDKVAEGWRLKIGQHSVIAEKVILATAADTAGLAPELSNQIVTAYFYQLATEPLEKGPALLPGCGAMSDAQGDLYFFRKDAAQRLITGGTFIVTRNWKRRLRSQVQQRLDHVFPDLGEWRIETQWSGYVAMTYDFFPRLAELGQNCFGWIGCNGRGVALSVSMGEQLAQLVAGQRHEDLSFPIETHAALPFRKLAPVGVAASLMSLRTSDCLQRLQNRS